MGIFSLDLSRAEICVELRLLSNFEVLYLSLLPKKKGLIQKGSPVLILMIIIFITSWLCTTQAFQIETESFTGGFITERKSIT